jgi:predicted nucleotidyltransferase
MRGDIKDFTDKARNRPDTDVSIEVLHGSYPKDEHNTGSDIDIGLIVEGEVDSDVPFKIVDRFRRQRSLTFSPQVLQEKVYGSRLESGASFYKNIEEEGVEI